MTDDVERSEAEKERAAIVAWLRAREQYWLIVGHESRSRGVEDAANAIERGDHLETAND